MTLTRVVEPRSVAAAGIKTASAGMASAGSTVILVGGCTEGRCSAGAAVASLAIGHGAVASRRHPPFCQSPGSQVGCRRKPAWQEAWVGDARDVAVQPAGRGRPSHLHVTDGETRVGDERHVAVLPAERKVGDE